MATNYVSFECVHIANADLKDPNEMYALAYADIDGYTANEDEEGTIICRVWLLRQPVDIKKNRGFIVDWHHNGYRMNETVLELINQAKKDLTSYVEDIIDQVFNKAYDMYRLKWMLDHKHSMKELLNKLQINLNKGAKDIQDAFNMFETMVGFDHIHDIWPDMDTFRNEEWENEDYMKELLSSADYEIWQNK